MALLRPCATSAGFTATPERPVRVDLGRLKEALRAAGYALLVDARIILVVRAPAALGGTESSLYDNGRVLVKTTDRDAAQAAYDDLEPRIEAVSQ